jgi:hypothetical protein
MTCGDGFHRFRRFYTVFLERCFFSQNAEKNGWKTAKTGVSVFPPRSRRI